MIDNTEDYKIFNERFSEHLKNSSNKDNNKDEHVNEEVLKYFKEQLRNAFIKGAKLPPSFFK